MQKIVIDGSTLSLEDLVKVCRNNYSVELSEESQINILASRKKVDEFIESGKTIYGITTGFGKFSDVNITKNDSILLQKNLIITHAVGAGSTLDTEIVRGIILLRVNALAKGYSGIRLSTINTLVEMLNKGVHPLIPEKGSLGASGDLAPLSHMVLPLIGLGKAEYKGTVMTGSEAMKRAGIKMVELVAKEGLALINGTQVMTAIGALTIYDGLQLSEMADMAAALTFEALNGITTALDPRVHEVRPHQGQIDTAKNMLNLLKGSKMTTVQGELRVQDAYSLRCVPQVHGASKDALRYITEKILIEMNSVTDNPIIFEETGISGGNFHGQPMALSFDFMAIALAELANISERRIERLVNPSLSALPAFLVEKGGLNSGFMIVQYSAAALVSENKILSHPASVDSIPSSANQEDHVSMGTIGARKAREVMKNLRRVLAMELMCACQAIDLRGKKQLGKGTEKAYKIIRDKVPKLIDDRELYEDINQCENLIIDGAFTDITRYI
ncbi:MAG: Histidine ammonia-lyase [Clostridiales bacterium 38_11]|nr:MAG: Histidine ammonia-lyase [Clostridiales bacterium 38_11]HBH13256.1 histidine ammonia-lyase [Clostridiales bacterium]